MALFCSKGQGRKRARYCIMPAMISAIAAKPKITPLYCVKVTSHGADETRPASAAPAPILTNKAGSAQQIRVPDAVNKLITELRKL